MAAAVTQGTRRSACALGQFLILLFLAGCEEESKSAYQDWEAVTNRPHIRVKEAKLPPTVDGRIDELYAKNAAPMTFVFLDGSPGKPKEPTTAYLVSHGDSLYLAVRAEKETLEHLVAKHTKRDGDVWQDEALELFIDPSNSLHDRYFHVAINAKGTMRDARERDDLTWNGDWEIATGREENRAWILEARIPYASIGMAQGKLNKVWSFNLTRSTRNPQKKGSDEDTAWSPTGTDSSHTPEMFGRLWLDAGNLENR